jgi:hypothetical protein
MAAAARSPTTIIGTKTAATTGITITITTAISGCQIGIVEHTVNCGLPEQGPG